MIVIFSYQTDTIHGVEEQYLALFVVFIELDGIYQIGGTKQLLDLMRARMQMYNLTVCFYCDKAFY